MRNKLYSTNRTFISEDKSLSAYAHLKLLKENF